MVYCGGCCYGWDYCFCQAKFQPHILNEKPTTHGLRMVGFVGIAKTPWLVFELSCGNILVDFSIGTRIWCIINESAQSTHRKYQIHELPRWVMLRYLLA